MADKLTGALPGADLDIDTMPAYWMLARLGKRVLRPGGIEATRRLLDGLSIQPGDRVVEFAPGLGSTARLILDLRPATYIGVERDQDAASFTRRHVGSRTGVSVQVGAAEDTGLPDASASVVVGEAMLTMVPPAQKERTVGEAFRVLDADGRYGIHELALVPDALPESKRSEIGTALSSTLRVGARPLTADQWCRLLTDAGFEIEAVDTAPMHLLKPRRVIQDEGFPGALRIVRNVLTTPAARRRVLAMRRLFSRYQANIAAICIAARKP